MTDEQLLLSYRAGNQDALQELMKKFDKTMKNLSVRYKNYAQKYNLEIGDLQQEGWIAFIKAVDIYEIRNDDYDNCTLKTYLYNAVEFAIKNAIRASKPRGYKTTTDIVTISSLNQCMFNDDENEDYIDNIESPNSLEDIDAFIQNDFIRQLRVDTLSLLDDVFGEPLFIHDKFITNKNLLYLFTFFKNPKCILALHYGLFDKAMTFKEISDEVGMCENAINEYEKNALWEIRRSAKGVEFMKNYAYEGYESRLDSLKIKSFEPPVNIISKLEKINQLIYQFDSKLFCSNRDFESCMTQESHKNQ